MLTGHTISSVSLNPNDRSCDSTHQMLEEAFSTVQFSTDEPHCSSSSTDPNILQVEIVVDEHTIYHNGHTVSSVSLNPNDRSCESTLHMLENPTLSVETPTGEPHISCSSTEQQIEKIEIIIDEPPCCSSESVEGWQEHEETEHISHLL